MNTGRGKEKKEQRFRGILKMGTIFEGKSSYTVTRLVRNPGPHGEYYVKIGDTVKSLELGPVNKSKLKWAGDVLKKMKTFVDNEKHEKKFGGVLEFIEYGHNSVHKTNYLITSAHGLQLPELKKVLKNELSPGCLLNIATQTLEAIRVLHHAGFVHRNIQPSSFSIGYGSKENEIYLAKFRITRQHFEDGTRNLRPARQKVPWLGTARYASVAAMMEQDQGRKDDLESWIYMIFSLFDLNAIVWKRHTKKETIEQKEKLKNDLIPDVYKTIPEEFKKWFELIAKLKYESEPDYEAFQDVITSVSKREKLDMTACDWAGKLTPPIEVKAIVECDNKSVDDICSGKDDFENGLLMLHGRKRNCLSTNDVLKNNGNVWKIVSKLGSGGFGDVYKVYNEKNERSEKGKPKRKITAIPSSDNLSKEPAASSINPVSDNRTKATQSMSPMSSTSPISAAAPLPSLAKKPSTETLRVNDPISFVSSNEPEDRKKVTNSTKSKKIRKRCASTKSVRKMKKYYAMKTEYEEGKRLMLRLKVEMQVFMAIAEERKKKEHKTKHFLEFIDRGKSDELKCKFIVMSLVGPSLDDCRRKLKVDLSESTIPYVIAIQTLEAVSDLHQIGFLHRDIKPANFAIGIGIQEHTIFMLDFGICRCYIDKKTKQHRAPRITVKFLGTLRFSSRACLNGQDQGRKDDLECWLYMIYDIMDPKNGLLWNKCKVRKEVLAAKNRLFAMTESEYPEDCPTRHLQPLAAYIGILEYQSTPDYEYIERKLHQYAENSGNKVTSLKLDWAAKLRRKEDHEFSSVTKSDHRSGSNEEDV